jgi:hypothetical protein
MVGRSVGWSHPASAEPGANRLIARNVNDAPTNALASGLGGIARIKGSTAPKMMDLRTI